MYWTHRPFTAKEFSSQLEYTYFTSGLFAKHPFFKDQLRTKLVSNNLRRLHLMGFLRRKRVKRRVNKSGKIHTIGFEYRYQVSPRSHQYLEYLADPVEAIKKHDEKLEKQGKIPSRLMMKIGLADRSSEEKDILIRLGWKKSTGRYKGRFPIRFGGLLALRYVVARDLLRKHGVNDSDFELKCLKVQKLLETAFPHLEQVFKKDADILSDPTEEDVPFLDLLWSLPSPLELAAQYAQSTDPRDKATLPFVLDRCQDVEPIFDRLSQNYQNK
jgi:hypothetical protein